MDSFENTDPPTQDDINITITWYDGGGPYKCIEAWNGVNWTPLAVVMSGSMFCHVPSHSPFEWSRELDSFETAKRAWDDFNLTITWYDGGGPYQVLHAWNGAKRTPLAVVMSSGSMSCMCPLTVHLSGPVGWILSRILIHQHRMTST